jgi:hypothetical protein
LQKIGKAYRNDTGEPLPDHTQVQFYLQQNIWHYQTFALNKGGVRLTMPERIGRDELFYLAESTNGKEIPDIRIDWEDNSVSLPKAPRTKETANEHPYALFTSRKRFIDKSYRFYRAPTETAVSASEAQAINAFEDEIMGADETTEVQDYVLFQTMEELIKEVVPSLFHRRSGEKTIVRVIMPEPMMRMATGGPVYIIDGIATKNTAFFMSLRPIDLVSLKVVKNPKKLLPLGLFGKNGIVIVETKAGNIREPFDPARQVEGLQKPFIFPAPKYSNAPWPIPDFRSTVYWNPSVKTNEAGKATVEFHCSDDLGKLLMRIDGITNSGQGFTHHHEIEVVLHPEKK